jgi:hypothetical protein
MAKLIFLPVANEIESGTYLLYDGACGTGGMLTVAEEALQELAAERGKQVATHLYGQEINAETYAICKADLLLKGESDAADNIVGGAEHSTLASDAFPSHEFDFMLSNPPYGKSWKSDLERMGGKDGIKERAHRARQGAGACHGGHPERRRRAVQDVHRQRLVPALALGHRVQPDLRSDGGSVTPDPAMAPFEAAFSRVFCSGRTVKPFGSGGARHQGCSDGYEGVQWNAGVDRSRGVVTVGVNLEGMKYDGWPIARFIEAERRRPTLPSFIATYGEAATTELWFSRDAWQGASRPAIREQHFGPEPPILLRDVSEALWQAMLREAYDCLELNGRRGRGLQPVTLVSGKRVEKEVSPHLQIKRVVRSSARLDAMDDAFEAARIALQPLRELVQNQSSA